MPLLEGGEVWLRGGGLDESALLAGEERAALEARDAAGRVIGSAAYRRVYGPRAELTLDVDGAYWHRGLPELLLATLCRQAARFGISTLLGRVPAADLRLLALLRQSFAAREQPEGGHVDVEIDTGAV